MNLARAAIHQAGAAFHPPWPAAEGFQAGWMIPAQKTNPVAMAGAVAKRWYATAGGLMAQTGAEPGTHPGTVKPQVQPTVTPVMLGAGGGAALLVKVLGATWIPAIAAGALVAGAMLFTAGAIVQAAKTPPKTPKGGTAPGAPGVPQGGMGMPVPGGTGMPMHGAPGVIPGGVHPPAGGGTGMPVPGGVGMPPVHGGPLPPQAS